MLLAAANNLSAYQKQKTFPIEEGFFVCLLPVEF